MVFVMSLSEEELKSVVDALLEAAEKARDIDDPRNYTSEDLVNIEKRAQGYEALSKRICKETGVRHGLCLRTG